MDERKLCFDCKHLYTDRRLYQGSGGGEYHCRLQSPGIVIGEFGGWTDASDDPVACDKYEADSN
jgi:hypothetical protein